MKEMRFFPKVSIDTCFSLDDCFPTFQQMVWLCDPPPQHLGSTLSTLEVFILCRLNSICWTVITESCKNRWTMICPDFQSSPRKGYLHKNILLKDQRIFFPPLYTQL